MLTCRTISDLIDKEDAEKKVFRASPPHPNGAPSGDRRPFLSLSSVGALEGAPAAKLAASALAAMNPHYHPYGGPELTSPHPPSPDNNYHSGHPGSGPPHMHPSNGHSMGPLGHQGGPHDPHPHHQHPAFSSGGPPPGSQHHQHHTVNNNNNTVKVCAGCGGKIVERFLLHALDRYWHNGCLKCSCCGAMLADIGASCYTKGGMILCRQDYMRLYGNSGACSACGQTIPASEFVMRSGGPSPQQPGAPPHVFHLKCFACSKCGSHLVPGDRYYMLAGSLVCEQDWHKLLKSSATTTVRKGKVGRPRRSRD